jgi:predicted pyridoxine 5'-phosphate oxidase superfamily flavin-nucleotide-binding protein
MVRLKVYSLLHRRPLNNITLMAARFLELAFTDSVLKAQQHYYGKSQPVENAPERDALTEDEISFIQSRDSFYMGTVSESNWPYLQHRGGQPGFLHVLSPTALAFADYKGNRQLLSTGNLAINDRVTLFFMDYPQRTRLKVLSHARVEDARQHPELLALNCSRNSPRRKSIGSWSGCFSSKSSPSIGTVRSTLRHATLRQKFRSWLLR